jgi:hypothetical protein
MSEGFMTPEDAERAIWSYYYQLDHHQDRRGAPLVMEPPDTLGEEEAKRLRDAQTPLWRKVQMKAWETARKKATSNSVASAVAGAIKGYGGALAKRLTTPAQREYLKDLMREASEEVHDEQARSTPGSLDPNTGLPINKHDLQVGRGVVSGRDLCMEAIVPPEDLALAATTWLPPEDGEDEANNSPGWGSELTHWQSLAFKPKDRPCKGCRGQGVVAKKVARATSTVRNIIIRDAPQTRRVRCDDCGGRGSIPYWDEDEVKAIRHNARLIGEKVAELEHDGLFNLRPINPNDAEMGDLVWKTDGGLTLGFRLTSEGYERMQEYCAEDDELQHVLHVLALSGKHIRDQAPDWAQREYNEAKPIQIQSGGISAQTGGGFSASTGGLNQ